MISGMVAMPCTGSGPDDAEEDGDPRRRDQRSTDDADQRHAARHQARPVHQVAQDQPGPEAVDEAGSEQERPVVDRDERLADRRRAMPHRRRAVLPQRHDRQEAEDADDDEARIRRREW